MWGNADDKIIWRQMADSLIMNLKYALSNYTDYIVTYDYFEF